MSEHTREIWDLPTTDPLSDQSTESKNLFTMLNSVHQPYFRLGAEKRFHMGTISTKKLRGNFGGAGRDRTDDLLLAKQALSQLSYGPDKSGGPGKT